MNFRPWIAWPRRPSAGAHRAGGGKGFRDECRRKVSAMGSVRVCDCSISLSANAIEIQQQDQITRASIKWKQPGKQYIQEAASQRNYSHAMPCLPYDRTSRPISPKKMSILFFFCWPEYMYSYMYVAYVDGPLDFGGPGRLHTLTTPRAGPGFSQDQRRCWKEDYATCSYLLSNQIIKLSN